MLRLDLTDPELSGNKWFKLKYNLEQARQNRLETILTFGGAYSNHIAATAAACRRAGLRCIGIIRGREAEADNPTLRTAASQGMELCFVSHDIYSRKEEASFKAELEKRFGPFHLIPEGGNNAAGLRGCSEILDPEWAAPYDYVFCACGTATTYAGLLLSCLRTPPQLCIGLSVLKGENRLPGSAAALLKEFSSGAGPKVSGNEALDSPFLDRHCILSSYAFNGYARLYEPLLLFKTHFESRERIPLDHVYTAKLAFGAFDLAAQGKLRPKSRLLLIHSGGLQGNTGFESRFGLSAGAGVSGS